MSVTYWRPRRRTNRPSVLMVTYLADGATLSGLVAIHNERKMHGLGFVLDATPDLDPELANVGDTILFNEGMGEPLVDSTGEKISWLDARNILDVVSATV